MHKFRTIALLAPMLAAPAFAQNPATYVAVDAHADLHPISPDIYGLAFAATSDLVALNAPLNRSGGDSQTSYNWQLNSDNRGNDWYFESIADSVSTPGYRLDNFITTTRAANVGAQALLTVPMINYIGSLGSNRSTMVTSTPLPSMGRRPNADPYNPDAGNGVSTAAGNPYITGNNPPDSSTPNSVSGDPAGLGPTHDQHMGSGVGRRTEILSDG